MAPSAAPVPGVLTVRAVLGLALVDELGLVWGELRDLALARDGWRAGLLDLVVEDRAGELVVARPPGLLLDGRLLRAPIAGEGRIRGEPPGESLRVRRDLLGRPALDLAGARRFTVHDVRLDTSRGGVRLGAASAAGPGLLHRGQDSWVDWPAVAPLALDSPVALEVLGGRVRGQGGAGFRRLLEELASDERDAVRAAVLG